MKKLLTLVLLILSITLAATSSYALVHFDFEQKYFAEPGRIVKDHCLIRHEGVYHLFYLRGDPAHSFGHATSTDLIHWNLEEPVLSVPDEGWDELGLWAPQILMIDNLFFMYFTGVNDYFCQQSGLAVSADLYNWYKVSYPIYHPEPSWAEWSETAWSHARDPFVFKHNGLYYQLLTAKTRTNLGAISCGVSNDRVNWQDIDPLYVHNSWHVLESAQMIEHNNKFNLFFTEEVVNGTSHMASDSLFSGWDIGTRTILDPGHAPEINLFDEEYIFSRHTIYNDSRGYEEYNIVIDTLKWSGDLPYVYKPWPLAHQWELVYGSAFIYQPTFGNNPYVRGEDIDVNFEGKCWIGTYERFQGPLKYGSPGGYQGEYAKGMIRSHPFTLTGNSMTLLVGGGDYPDQCYVALVRVSDGEVLCKETGKNTDVMDLRTWNIKPYKDTEVYIEIADQSTAVFGHINCDNIVESMTIVDTDNIGDGSTSKHRFDGLTEARDRELPRPQLHQNVPNPFNPTTTISFTIPAGGHVTLDIFDVNGSTVRRLIDRHTAEGTYYAEWNGRDDNGSPLSSGIYFYRLRIDGHTINTRKMVLLK